MKPKSINDALSIILAVVVIATAIVSIVLIIIKLVGKSPDLLTIGLWIGTTFITLQALIISLLFQMKGSIGRMDEFRQGSREFQKETIIEIKTLKEKVSNIENKLNKLV